MAVAYRSKSTRIIESAGGSTPIDIASAEPSGAAENDILIGMLAFYGTGFGTVTAPAGWTSLYSRTVAGFSGYFQAWWIRRGASAPSFSVSWDGNSSDYSEALVVAYSGCKTTGNPYNAFQSAESDSDATPNPDPPSITTSVSDTLNVVIGMGWAGASSSWATPSGYTARDAGASGESWSVFDKALVSATTENCAEITGTAASTSCWIGLAIALEPAESGATNTDYSPGVGSSVYGGLAALVNPQFASPSADATDGNWTPSTGADLYACIDETLRSDTDYIQSGANPSSDSCTVKLGTITDPGTDVGFHLQYAAGAVGSTGQVVVSLRQGNSPGTEIAAWTHTGLPVGSYQEFDDPVTSAEAANITDFSDLYLRIVAS